MNAAVSTFLELVNHILGKHPETATQIEALARQAQGLPKLFVPPGHYFSPIVNTNEIANLYEHLNADAVPGIAVDGPAQLALWNRFLQHLQRISFPDQRTQGHRYFFNNPAYGIGDASIYFAMLLEFKPRNVIEVGSGYSSAFLLDTVEKFLENETKVTFIEPYPDLLYKLISEKDRENITLIETGIQGVDVEIFKKLAPNDFVFIDSTHILKTGSDVHHDLFKVLPALGSGVIIHFHDVFWPFEYPKEWVMDENRSWNELYALRAYLTDNDAYEILFFNDFFAKKFGDVARADHPPFMRNPGGGLWLRKR